MASLLNEILNWTTTSLTGWQRDATRRLFQKQSLDPQDYDDLYAMLKSAHGIVDPHNLQPIPFAQSHLPAQVAGTSPVILKVMRDLKNVNRIASGQKLEFKPKGVTIVYGDNGSGKTGYSRVLKQACRARDLTEIVLPDAYDTKAIGKIPEAIFDVEIGGQASSINWKQGADLPDELSTIAVFDGRCARAYLDSEQDVAYLPYGLDIVENLGRQVLPLLTQRLNAEIATVNVDTTPFADLAGDTVVGKMISSLSATTDPQRIISLATLTPDEINRLGELDKALAENDPKAKAKSLRLLAQRIDSLISRIDVAVAWVEDKAIENIKTYDIEAEAACKAEIIAAESFRSGKPLLLGTGDEIWKGLFEAARRFSTEVAYPNQIFPHVEPGAQCPLCQQQLDSDTKERMKRFGEYMKQDTAKVAVEKRQQREREERKFSAASLGLGLDVAISEELKQLDSGILSRLQNFEDKIEKRKVWVLNAIKIHVWDSFPALVDDPRPALKSLSAMIVSQAANFEKAGDENQKKLLESERSELRARSSLLNRHKAVIDLIKRMQLKAALTKCKDDLKTKAISDKAKDFASRAVTIALKNALDAEFKTLGVGHIKTKLNERVEQGKMKHKLVLDLPVMKELNEILSEGEQRAIAIGSFLAELSLSGLQGGIVFDDPVSSLDHYRRKDVARRLVEESKNRQVIILTHDTSFLGELRDMIEQQGVDHLIFYLEWRGNNPGYVCNGLPWEHKSYQDRLDMHEKAQKLLENSWPAYPSTDDNNKMRHEYSKLRATIERVIQDVVFNGVIQRYRDWIKVPKLEGVVGFTVDEFKEINRLYKACCDVVDSHDSASAKNAPVPSANQYGQDIVALKKIAETIRNRKKGII